MIGRFLVAFSILLNVLRVVESSVVDSLTVNDHDGGICEGRCQLSMSCWMEGGRVEPAGNCHSIFQVCCDFGARNAQSRSIEVVSRSDDRNRSIIHDLLDLGPIQNDPQCGRPVIAKRRVVGGTEAGFGAFPWQALIRIGAARCGGALVSHQHVVTAGHCVHSISQKFGEFPPSDIDVYLGEYSLYGDWEPLQKKMLPATRIYLHPKYEFTLQADRYDVAILKLSERIRYEPHILPICLPTKPTMEEGMVAMVAGWGAMDPDSPKRPKELQVVDVNLVDSRKCERWHRNNNIDINIYEDMMCAGHENGGKDACQGDSGGPLMNKDPDTGKWTLVGIVSAGFSCAKPGQPGIYHNVSLTTDWIYHTIKSP